MVARASGIDSVFVRVTSATTVPSDRYSQATPAGEDELRRTPYLALVYSQLSLPITPFVDPPTGQPTEWAGDPLLGGETFFVHWGKYSEYLASYLGGGKGEQSMEKRLFEALPANLSAILSGQFGDSRPTRTWFHSEAPELGELPWELVAFANGHRASTGGSFVRGAPPDAATPLVPVVGRLRLGVVDPTGRASAAFNQATTGFGDRLEVIPLSGGVRSALRQAAEQGLELLHIVASATVTSSYDGGIDVPGGDEPPLAASEAVALLRGSRTRLLGLTTPADDPAATSAGGYGSAVAYRAFAAFATSPQALPSIVAPLGPMDDAQVTEFWTTFYGTLGETLEIEGAMAAAQRARTAAVALFLRQLQPATFRRVSHVEQPQTDPSIVGADLASSKELVEQFENLKASLGVKTTYLDRFVKGERKRQSKLEADVSDWIEGVEES